MYILSKKASAVHLTINSTTTVFSLILVILKIVGTNGTEISYETIDVNPSVEITAVRFDRHRREVMSTPVQSSPPTSAATTRALETTQRSGSSRPTTTASTTSPTIAPTTDPTTQRFTNANGDTVKPEIVEKDDHVYYEATYHTNDEESFSRWWIPMGPHIDGVHSHISLADSHRLAAKVSLEFEFLFYGHTIDTVTIATGGFLYMSSFLHSFLTATQYIAPFMGNFDTSLGGLDSLIYYKSTDDVFTVQWNRVHLKDHQDYGPYTFQVQLHRESGLIVFAYESVPHPLSNVSSKNHPVKVGLSDAFYWDVGHLRTIYTYHTVEADVTSVADRTVILLRHKQTCNMIKDCGNCLQDHSPFTCNWCSRLNQCSDGFDRLRQEWIRNGCPRNAEERTPCPTTPSTTMPPSNSTSTTDVSTPVNSTLYTNATKPTTNSTTVPTTIVPPTTRPFIKTTDVVCDPKVSTCTVHPSSSTSSIRGAGDYATTTAAAVPSTNISTVSQYGFTTLTKKASTTEKTTSRQPATTTTSLKGTGSTAMPLTARSTTTMKPMTATRTPTATRSTMTMRPTRPTAATRPTMTTRSTITTRSPTAVRSTTTMKPTTTLRTTAASPQSVATDKTVSMSTTLEPSIGITAKRSTPAFKSTPYPSGTSTSEVFPHSTAMKRTTHSGSSPQSIVRSNCTTADILKEDTNEEGNQTDCAQMNTAAPLVNRHVTTEKNRSGAAVGGAIGAFFGVIIVALIIVVVYGYFNPLSAPGQFLIRNRPGELAHKLKVWKRSEEDASAPYKQDMQIMPNGLQA